MDGAFIDPESYQIGVRTDFFKRVNDAYPRGKAAKETLPSQQQIKEMGEQLFGEKDAFLADYKRRLKRSYLGF
jgi:hypothetical protein